MHLHNGEACSPQGVLETGDKPQIAVGAQSEFTGECVPWVLEGGGDFEVPGLLLRRVERATVGNTSGTEQEGFITYQLLQPDTTVNIHNLVSILAATSPYLAKHANIVPLHGPQSHCAVSGGRQNQRLSLMRHMFDAQDLPSVGPPSHHGVQGQTTLRVCVCVCVYVCEVWGWGVGMGGGE